jgi:hypothetical protein
MVPSFNPPLAPHWRLLLQALTRSGPALLAVALPQGRPRHAERLLELFGGAEHVFFRDCRDGTKLVCERVFEPLTIEHVRRHLDGAYWIATYPLRSNSSTRFAAIRVVASGKFRGTDRARALVPEDVRLATRAVVNALGSFDLTPVVSLEPGRGFMSWLLAEEPVPAPRLRGHLGSGVSPSRSCADRRRATVRARTAQRHAEETGMPRLFTVGVRSTQRAACVDLRP